MIKLGMMVRNTPAADVETSIDFARELELDTVDVHLSGLNRGPAYLQRIRTRCLRRGLSIGYAGAGSFVGPPEQAGERMRQGREDADTAALLGAPLLRVFARHKWPGTVAEQEALWGPMIESFRRICDYAAGRGVSVALQNHDNGSFAMTADQVLRIIGDVDHPNFSFLMDTGQWSGAIGSHPRGEFDPDIDLYRDYLERTVEHATCVRAKIYKIDGGREEFLDYERILGILRRANYNGHIGLVFEVGDRNSCSVEECMRLAVEHLREVIAGSA